MTGRGHPRCLVTFDAGDTNPRSRDQPISEEQQECRHYFVITSKADRVGQLEWSARRSTCGRFGAVARPPGAVVTRCAATTWVRERHCRPRAASREPRHRHRDIGKAFVKRIAERRPPVMVNTGPVRDVIKTGDDVDLAALPVPLISELDGGPYITSGIGVSKDPEYGAMPAPIG